MKDNKCDIIWLGISAKKDKHGELEEPLSSSTNSGQLIDFVEDELNNIKSHRTNLVKFPPMDLNDKLRYPTKNEIQNSIDDLIKEIENLKPRIVILLGEIVRKSISDYFNIEIPKCNNFVIRPIEYGELILFSTYHPSYVSVYKKKDKRIYKDTICKVIYDIFQNTEGERN